MILAAGRGERMRPLTDSKPKPLLSVRGVPLLSHHLRAFLLAGYSKVVINTAWLEEKIVDYYGDSFSWPELEGSRIHIEYSKEGADFGGALETAGGVIRAQPLLDSAFWAVAGDVFIPGFQFSNDIYERFVRSPQLAHLFLVPNPPHNLKGDFGLSAEGLAMNLQPNDLRPTYTYSSVGLFKKALFQAPFSLIKTGNPQGIKAALAPLLRQAMDQNLISAELLNSNWTDVGTPERLAALNSA